MTHHNNLIQRRVRFENCSTTVGLELVFWTMLDEISECMDTGYSDLIKIIDDNRGKYPRASAIRIYVLVFSSSKLDVEYHDTDGGSNNAPEGLFSSREKFWRRRHQYACMRLRDSCKVIAYPPTSGKRPTDAAADKTNCTVLPIEAPLHHPAPRQREKTKESAAVSGREVLSLKMPLRPIVA